MNPARYREILLSLFYITLVSIPLSVEWFSPNWHVGLTLVSEPLMVVTAGGLALGLLVGWLRWPTRYNRLDLLLGMHFAVLLLATLLSDNKLVSTKYYLSLVLYLLTGYALPKVLELTGREWRRAGASLALGTFLLVGYVVIRHLQTGFSFSISYSIAQPFSANGHTNLTVQLEPLILALNLLLLGCGWAQAGLRRLLVAAGLTVVLLVVAFSFSRASFCSLLLQAGLLLAYTRWAASRRLLLVWASAGLLIAGVWQIMTHIHDNASLHNTPLLQEMSTVQDFSPANDSNAERLNRWKFCLQLFHETPVLGIGPGTFPDRYLDYVRHTPSHPIYLDTQQRMNAHNLYLDWLVEAGALGLLSGLLVLGYPLVQLLPHLRRRPMPLLQLGLLAYFAFFLLHSLAQDFWQEPRVIVLFWLVLSWQRYCARPQPYAAPQPLPAQALAESSSPLLN
ncbi:IctB family putative bicarbonate transporter [Hymenobacter ginsengisoli]|uniref:IctB family putative bicarbonate transporter n=1 Tax=Hymenobacter ginsengisoli TaxID=1051626 RepID=A0ABP8QK94_9BACT|nr:MULTISPECIES: O-antigen ligase family protein [unclassified Hymenobacter]MBO2033298.1 O-antigen ligase family protein [Hymenobacter sp. BT559]